MDLQVMEDRLGSTGEPPDTDARLVAEALLERSAFAALYRRYVDAIYRYAYHRLGTKEQAEDATSQIFLKALIALPSHKSDRSFRSWLFTIAHNVVTDSYRARRPQEPLDHIYELEDKSASPEDEALHRVQRNELREMLYLLPIDQRHILELRLAGLT